MPIQNYAADPLPYLDPAPRLWSRKIYNHIMNEDRIIDRFLTKEEQARALAALPDRKEFKFCPYCGETLHAE